MPRGSKGTSKKKAPATRKSTRKGPAKKSGEDEEEVDNDIEENAEEECVDGGRNDDDPDDNDNDNEEGDGLESHHRIELDKELEVKTDTVKDLLLMFSDKTTVTFKTGDVFEKVTGRWCLSCK
ncbi:hypothetical protein Hypma_007294 [Hypsizygus marmoreus]|uniref:Uncharacterized protein n=1 Tax=Hypsizygus marmoreus TaxID=39966 RepID=A0A369K786_HYPMA|nr:hypothetical protein Hypma_007294 [Hypsizygus marmoreus]